MDVTRKALMPFYHGSSSLAVTSKAKPGLLTQKFILYSWKIHPVLEALKIRFILPKTMPIYALLTDISENRNFLMSCTSFAQLKMYSFWWLSDCFIPTTFFLVPHWVVAKTLIDIA